MKILFTSIVDLTTSQHNRPHEFAEYLSRKHDVTVLSINDWWKNRQNVKITHYNQFEHYLENIDYQYITNKKISPIFQELLSPLFLRNFRNESFDIIFNYNTLISGYYLAKKFKIPMVYDLADDLPAMIQNSPQIPSFLGFTGAWIGERKIHKTIEASSAVTGTLENFKSKYHIENKKFHIIPNGVNTNLFRRVDNAKKRELHLENFLVLGYVGVLREWINFMPVYSALSELENIKLLVLGQEGLYSENKKIVDRMGISDKVFFTGNISYQEVPRYIAAMDICLIPFKKNEITRNAIPLKLFEYMACEKPVISTRLPGIIDSVSDRISYADTKEEIISQIKIFQQSTYPNEELIENRNFIVNNYDWSISCKKIEDIIEVEVL